MRDFEKNVYNFVEFILTTCLPSSKFEKYVALKRRVYISEL